MRSLPGQPLRWLRTSLHLLVLALLAVVVARQLTGHPAHPAATVLVAAAMALLYAGGLALLRRPGPVPQAVWLGALSVVWLLLLVLSVDGVWLAFPLFFLYLHLLPRAVGLTAVGSATVAAVAAYAWHDRLTPAAVIGPVIGAAVAVATVAGYEAILRESGARQRLIEELEATQSVLAAREHDAGVLAERERLAREIHDTLAQGLTSIQLLLRAAERALPEDVDAARRHIDVARRAAGENLDEARRFVRALPAGALAGRSLEEALSATVGAAVAGSALEWEVDVQGSRSSEVSPAVATALVRIAQSAVANTVQHARASRVRVTLTYMEDEVVLDVVDDGTGFDEGAVPAAAERGDRGHGLDVMRARAVALGGTVSVESSEDEGSAVAATFPVEAGAAR